MFIGFLTFVNCYDVKSTTKMQNVFMFTKIGALILVILLGVYWMAIGTYINILFDLMFFNDVVFIGNTENFNEPFANTETDPGKISIAFYSGIFSYAGW